MASSTRRAFTVLVVTTLIAVGQLGTTLAFSNDQFQALVKLKVDLGPSELLTSWGEGTSSSPCQWTGITCDTTQTYVTEIRLASAGLQGQLTNSIAAFPQLTVLQLQYNQQLKGPIPSAIGSLANLQVLDLSYNPLLGGTLPPEIGNLFSLRSLDVQSSNLVGPLPSTITALTNLTHLSVMQNSLNGTIPAGISKLKQLQWFEIAQNQFSGPLPDELGNMTAAQHFHFYNNSLSGPIPRSLGQLPNLIHLVLYNNQLTGPLPAELGNIAHLKILELSNNNFSFLPPELGNLLELQQLKCSDCGLMGAIPNYPPMAKLLYVDLSSNKLAGQYPDFLTTSPLLVEVNLESNQFTDILRGVGNEKIWLAGNPACAGSKVVEVCTALDPQYPTPTMCAKVVRCGAGLFPNPNVDGCPCNQAVNVTINLVSPPFGSNINYTIDELESAISTAFEVEKASVHVQGFATIPIFRIRVQVFPPAGYPTFTALRVSQLVGKVDNISVSKLPPLELGTIYADPISFATDATDGFVESSNSSLQTGAIVGIVFGCIVFLVIIILLALFAWHHKARADKAIKSQTYKSTGSGYDNSSTVGGPAVSGPKRFGFQEVAQATNNFAADRVIGKGGYGSVYKGILGSGQAVAVKRSAKGSTQGAAEFNMEVELLSRVHHKNLVNLVGYCLDDGEELLVYEYMENGTIRENIITKGQTPLSFIQRVEVALGSARGLQYLHEGSNPPIIHRDIKSSNILLDRKMVAKVADFGLCKVAANEVSAHSTNVKGTQGYLDPEYYRTQQITTKSDVYSFGVIMLELMTGRQPIETQSNKFIVTEVKKSLRAEGGVHKLADTKMGNYPPAILERVVALALHCTAEAGENRPSMREVVGLLEEIESALKNGTGHVGKRMTSLETIDDDFSSVSQTFHVVNMRSPHRSSTTPNSSDMNTSASSDFYCSGIVATDYRVEPK